MDLRKGDYILLKDFKNLEEFLEVIRATEGKVKRFKRSWWTSSFTHLYWKGSEWWASSWGHYYKKPGCIRDPEEFLGQPQFELKDGDYFRSEDFDSEEQFDAVRALGGNNAARWLTDWDDRVCFPFLSYTEHTGNPWAWEKRPLKGRLLTPQQVLGEKPVTKPHPHAESMAKYAEDAKKTDKPWLLWEGRKERGWGTMSCSPAWWTDWKYRRISERPQEVTLAGVTFPRPGSEPLQMGQSYYVPQVEDGRLTREYIWEGDLSDTNCLTKGLVQLTREGARKQAKALLAALKEVLNED